MKAILSSALICLTACPVFAQTAGLFPELAASPTAAAPTAAPSETTPAAQPTTAPAAAPAAQTASPAAKQTAPAPLFPELKTSASSPQIADTDSGKIRLVLDDVTSVLPPARNFSYCTASLILENETAATIEKLTVTLKYEPLTTSVSFSGVKKKEKQTQSITLVGKACEQILQIPQMTIDACVAPPLQGKACESKVQFIPIP